MSRFETPFKMPIYANSLAELSWILKELDRKYGSPDIKEPKKKNGEYTIRLILKYLSEHKQSTCEDIAKNEFENNLPSKRKLKSITDDIRKFVKNNLMRYSNLVYGDATKKAYNKKVQAYSLSPIGILYSMHLLAKVRETHDLGYPHDFSYSEIDFNLIRNLVKEYSHTLPKVFGRWKLYEKIFGKDFEFLIINSFLNIFLEDRSGVMDERFLLNNYVLTSFAPKYLDKKKNLHELIGEQISLIFYIHLRESIEHYLFDRESGIIVITKKNKEETEKFFKENKINFWKEYKNFPKIAKKMWLQLMKEDKELKIWYDDFLKEAIKSKRREQKVLTQYQKEVFSKLPF